jgi:rare lipoprotein A
MTWLLPGLIVLVVSVEINPELAQTPPSAGLASWYGESHRGKLMAIGEKYDPEKMTAASWFFPLGTSVRVSFNNSSRSVVVATTDRGPARSLVREGRIIDLSEAAFAQLADTSLGLISVTIEPVT